MEENERIAKLIHYYHNPDAFSQFCRKAVRPGSYYILDDFHKKWLKILNNNKSLLLAPRGHLKTTIVLDYIVHQILLHSKDQQKRVWLVQDAWKTVKPFLRELEAVLTSKDIQELFGNFKVVAIEGEIRITPPLLPWANKAASIDPSEPTIQGFSVDKGVTGKHIGDDDIIVFDDAFVSADASSIVMQDSRRDKIYNKWLSATTFKTKIIVTGTRYTPYDEYEILPDKGYATNIDSRSAILPDGTPLWKNRFSLEDLAEQRSRITPTSWALQYMNDVKATLGLMFPADLLEKVNIKSIDNEVRYKCYGIDVAYGGKDKTTICEAAVTKDNKIILSPKLMKDYGRDTLQYKNKDIITITGKYPTYIEANGPQLVNLTILKDAGHHQIYPYNPGRNSKGIRAQALLNAMQREEILIIDDVMGNLTSQLLAFTGEDGGKDDMVDAAVIAYESSKKMISNIAGKRFTSLSPAKANKKNIFKL